MARGDVTRLVPQHGSQLRLRVQMAEDAAGDEDRAARERERVHARVVDDLVRPGQVRPAALL